MKNIILIGMPGAGKSTIGVVLAKVLQMNFLDTDLLIQRQTGRSLQDILDKDGPDFFLKTENDSVRALECENCVVATGGSVVLSAEAMDHLKTIGTVIYLRAGYGDIKNRINNLSTRGIAFSDGQTLLDIYRQRVPLYEKYADITVDCKDFDCSYVIEQIKSYL